MKFHYLLIPCALLVPLKGTGQNYAREFGTVSQYELEMDSYSADRSAEAVVLYDIGKSGFERHLDAFEVVFERTTKIKILTEAGIEWGNIEIPYYREGDIYEVVYDVEAYTYNEENGKLNKTPLNPAGMHDERINSYWNLKKIAMPDVKKGAVIEVRYKVRSQYLFNLRDWEFQWRIPVVYSEYEVSLIPFFEYSWLSQGISKFDAQTSNVKRGVTRQFGPVEYQDVVHKFVMTTVPAFDSEEYIATINDYIMKIDFQLTRIYNLNGVAVDVISTWPDMIRELLKSNEFGRYVQRSEKLAARSMDLSAISSMSQAEKFDFVIRHVKANYNWNGSSGRYASKQAKEFMEDKHGNCADINLFATGMLQAAGIEAWPVWISTRENGKIKYDYPLTDLFNYVLIVAMIDGEYILSDATDMLILNNRIPARCMNDKGLIIKKDAVEWMDLKCRHTSEIHRDFVVEINPSQFITKIETSATEYDALSYRYALGEDHDRIIDNLRENGYEIIDTSLSVLNYLDINEPYIMSYSIADEPEIINNKIYFAPFLQETLQDNPLKQLTRNYPVDLTYPIKRRYTASVTIPDGYGIDFIPENHQDDNDLFALHYEVNVTENTVHIDFMYHFKQEVYQPRDYSKIKSCFNDIVKKGNEKIVFAPLE